jgi:hypothetical protein
MFTAAKKYQAIISAGILILATMFGIPIKSYVKYVDKQIATDEDYVKQTVAPHYWTPYMSKTYARGYIALEYPQWGRSEWSALKKLWGKESAWNHKAANPKSTAYGVAQVLKTKPGTPAPLQIEKGLAYIEHRYDKPSIAWSHWRKHGWY